MRSTNCMMFSLTRMSDVPFNLATLRGKHDGVVVAAVFGCRRRRPELLSVSVKTIQQLEDHCQMELHETETELLQEAIAAFQRATGIRVRM